MNPDGKDSFCLKLFHLVPLSAYFQSSALNMKLLSFFIRTYMFIRAFNEKTCKTFYVPGSMMRLGFVYL